MTDKIDIAPREWRDPPAGGGSDGSMRPIDDFVAHYPGDPEALVDALVLDIKRLEAEIERLRAIVDEYRACQMKIDCLSRAGRR